MDLIGNIKYLEENYYLFDKKVIDNIKSVKTINYYIILTKVSYPVKNEMINLNKLLKINSKEKLVKEIKNSKIFKIKNLDKKPIEDIKLELITDLIEKANLILEE